MLARIPDTNISWRVHHVQRGLDCKIVGMMICCSAQRKEVRSAARLSLESFATASILSLFRNILLA